MSFKPRRSSPRLPTFEYTGAYAYHIVISTARRAPRFRDANLVASCVDALEASARRYSFEVAAYCFMPDHLHLLVTGSEGASLIRFVQHFKQATARRHPGLWQRSFYDHMLRDEESIEDVASYVWGNPVRAGLADDGADYPFSGPREALMGETGRLGTVEDRAEALSLRSGLRSASDGALSRKSAARNASPRTSP